MSCSKKRLNKKLNDLYTKINDDSLKQEELIALKHDFIYTKRACEEIDKQECGKQHDLLEKFGKDIDDFCQSDNFKISSAEAFLKHKDAFIKLILNVYTYQFLSTNRIKFQNIPNDKNIDMTKSFFNFLAPEFKNIFDEIINNNTWLLESNNKNSYGGFFYPQITNPYPYVFYSYNKNEINYLPHEIGHAYSLHNHEKDYASLINSRNSCFRESFSRFCELALFDYHKNSDYRGVILKYKEHFFSRLQYFFDMDNAKLDRLESYNLKYNIYTDKDDHFIFKENLDDIISTLVSIYMFYLYKNDFGKYTEFNQILNENMGKDENKIWEYILSNDLKQSINEECGCLNDEIITYKKSMPNKRFLFFR